MAVERVLKIQRCTRCLKLKNSPCSNEHCPVRAIATYLAVEEVEQLAEPKPKPAVQLLRGQKKEKGKEPTATQQLRKVTGKSYGSLLQYLEEKRSDIFAKPRTSQEIGQMLSSMGVMYSSRQIKSVLAEMVQRQHLLPSSEPQTQKQPFPIRRFMLVP